jgi:phage tail sheath protein FI
VPEYLAPGVYVEEVSYRAKSIEGVPTSTAGFVGETSTGPTNEPCLVQSVAEFESLYGTECHVAQAASAFFAQGGRRLFVFRVSGAVDHAGALRALEEIREIAVVAAPGADATDVLVAHATRCNRFALVDPPKALSVEEMVDWRTRVDSPYAAAYYPWLRVGSMDVAPSGVAAGLYARTDLEHGVWKAPAGVNEPITGATGLERVLSEAEIGELVAGGVNPFRALPDGAIVAWGARTTSSDPDWKYVNVRRYLSYLEHSIDRGTQWTVFEPNGTPLWADVQQTIGSFLEGEHRAGGLVGRTADEAYFVRCDQTTMTQEDIDQGLLVCLVGVAPARPADFVIVRIGRWTADHRP